MRTRILGVIVVLVGLLTVVLGVPLALTGAASAQQQLFTDRLTDTISFASLAERPITEGDTAGLLQEIRRYDQVFGIAVMVFDSAGRIVASSREPPPVLNDEGRRRVQLASARNVSAPYPLFMPWDNEPMVLAEPVLIDGEVRGVVVTVSPIDALRADVLSLWSLVAAAVVLALGLGVIVSLPVVRWILRPVQRLDQGTDRVAAAVLAGRVAEPLAVGSGPPELRRLAASFDRMADTVTRAYAAQRAFIADASHQLRNPLTALRLRLSNLEGHVAPAAADDHLGALEEAERLSGLLDGLLALARADRVTPVAVIAVDPAVDDRIEAWRPLAEHSGLRLTRVGDRGLLVSATAGAIETVLDAVLDNAIKFSPAGGEIVVEVLDMGDEVELAVRDHGPGMRPEELNRATDRFWRSPTQSNTPGSGLGLAIAARTVEIGGGSLHLELPEAGGLRVVVRLPRVREHPPPAGDDASAQPDRPSQTSLAER